VLADDIVRNQKGLDHLIQKDGRKSGDRRDLQTTFFEWEKNQIRPFTRALAHRLST
jgi:hypothetical protein